MRRTTDRITSAGRGRSCAMCRRDRGSRPTRVGDERRLEPRGRDGGEECSGQASRSSKSPGDGKGDEEGQMVAGRRRGRDVT